MLRLTLSTSVAATVSSGPSRLGPAVFSGHATFPFHIQTRSNNRSQRSAISTTRRCPSQNQIETKHSNGKARSIDMSSEDTFEIIIIGGGNAGLALTCALCPFPINSELAYITKEGC